jgi:hypothetical protein
VAPPPPCKWGANRRCAHADAAEERGDHEDCVVVGQRGEDIQDADGEQHLLAAEQVGHLAGNQRAGDGADKRDCYRETEAALSASVVPEITAVSNPKIRPPSEATIALRTTSGFMRNTVDTNSDQVMKTCNLSEQTRATGP